MANAAFSAEPRKNGMSERSETRVAIFGLGGVGTALLELLAERHPPIRLTGIADSQGGLAGDLDPLGALAVKRAGSLPAEVPHSDLLKVADPDVVVDVMSCDAQTAEPALSVILEAFEHGAHVVTANKSPLAYFWSVVRGAAERARRRLGYSSAAGAALPAVAVARSLARVDEITAFEGVLTGTTTFVLDQMAKGVTFQDAVSRAQEQGIAEPDPTLDLGGWDTAAKVVILANTLWNTNFSINDVNVTGLCEDVQPMHEGRPTRLVGRARREGTLVVEPMLLTADHPLVTLKEREKGVVFFSPAIGQVMVAGGRSHAKGAAAAVLGDVLELVGED
jgi:homoserine dehydrogenase